jgi:phosphatidylserine/phosphatidylglycerophosphate/cardiolipin synthase-like enzyme
MTMYELDDARVETALAADEARGVAVRVILSGGYKGATSTMNAAAYGYLAVHGVPVRYSPAYFSLTHQKSLVADGSRALIMTFNLVSKYYPTGRDFGIADGDVRDVVAIERTFDDDWNGAGMTDSDRASLGGNNGDGGDDLLWSPGSKGAILDLIKDARKSLSIYNEEMADMDVTEALIDAAERGVAVYVVMTGASEWKWEFAELATAGAHVRTYADDDTSLYIHAKMVLADEGTADERVFVGSENFSEGSLNENRELGSVTTNHAIIAGFLKTFAADWHRATPFAK